MTTHIKNLIESFFAKSKEKFTVYQKLDLVLDAVLIQEVREGVSIEEVKDRELILKANSSSIMYSFNLQKSRVLEAIKREVPTIKGIIIKVV